MTGPATLHLPVNTLALRRGGLVKAVMLRANALAAADDGRAVVIEVLAFQPRLEEDIAELVHRGFLDPRVHVRSILRCLDPSAPGPTATDPIRGCVHHGIPFDRAPGGERPAVDPAADPRAVVLADTHRDVLDRLLPQRLRPRVTTRDDAGRIRYVETFNRRGQVLRREEYGSGDRVVRVLGFRPGDSRPVVHRWLGRDGRCFLAVWQPAGGRNWGNAFAAADGLPGLQVLANPKALYRLAFEQALRDEPDPVLFSEFREGLPNLPGGGVDDVVVSVRHPTMRRVAVVHSNHALQGERELPLRSSPNFTALLTGLRQWDLLVTATEQQKADIGEQYGYPERIAAIPHYAPQPPAEIDPAYDRNRFVLVARIHRKKRVDEAIEVFRLVVDENPDARLEVYGFGYGDELEARITALVEERGLAKNVEFRGFVEDVSKIYAGACASVQTSESEGFGMALLESLANGVPVVAYDVAYGAREAIRDGVDGYVVPWGDRPAMARRMVELSADPALRARLSDAGPAGAARFSRERYVEEWTAALAGLPVREDESSGLSARVVAGRLELTGAGAATVVVRVRGRGEEIAASARDGVARAELPAAPVGEILDVFLRSGEKERRAAFAGTGRSDDPTWRVYATEHGNLSVKKVPAATPAAAPATAPSAAARAARRARRVMADRRARG